MKTSQLHIEQIYLNEIENLGISEDILDEIRKSNKDILSNYTPSRMKEACEEKLKTQTNKAIHFPSYKTIGLLAAACLTLVITISLIKSLPVSDTIGIKGILSSTERAKGSGARLFVYKKEANGASVLKSFSKVSGGDIIQLSYVAAGNEFGAIISIDGNGIITRHLPDDGNMASTLKPGGEVALNFSYQLDNAPSFERFILISSSRNFSLTSIINSITQAGKFALGATSDLSLYIPSGAVITDILLLK